MDTLRIRWRYLVVALPMIWTSWVQVAIPVTWAPPGLLPTQYTNSIEAVGVPSVPSLRAFGESLPRGDSDRVVGVYVKGKLALRVIEQPAGLPGYVTTQPDAASHFAMAQAYGTLGLVAHNTLAGRAFFDLEQGDRIVLVAENGGRHTFTVTGVRRVQALSPFSSTSAFRDLAFPLSTLSAQTVFNQVYGGTYSLVLQTCISHGGNDAWGRLFVLAQAVSADVLASAASRGTPEGAWAD